MGLLERFVTEESIFTKERDALRSSYLPERLLHRDEQLDRIAGILSSAVRGAAPSNVIFYGKTGTGKTASARFMQKEMLSTRTPVPVKYIYINCEITDTPYGVMQNICSSVLEGSKQTPPPSSGLSIEKLYEILVGFLKENRHILIVVLDEVDRLVEKNGNDILYPLSRINEDLVKGSSVSLIAIANDLHFTERLDARVLSSFSGERILFPPYTSTELKNILRDRAKLAFKEGAVSEGIISLCATLGAQEHGDARRVLDLLRVAGEIADRSGEKIIREEHVYKAKQTIESDCISEAIRTLPHQSKIVMLAILLRCCGTLQTTTGELYATYKALCNHTGLTPLTQRRVTDLITDLEGLGLIQTNVRSMGRGGRTRFMHACIPFEDALSVIEEDDLFKNLKIRKLFQAKLF
jgi:cell division control protein 6